MPRAALAGLLICAAALNVQAQEIVEFRQGAVTLKAALYKPPGNGPFPGIVALHGCGGIGRDITRPSRRHADWGERLQAQGFAVLMPDSYGTRGLGPQCNNRERSVTPGGERTLDAIAAREWLAARDFARKDVSLLGWSNGGSTVLHVLKRADAGGFKRAIAFYPGCRVLLRQPWRPAVPVLILIGEADDWTPAAPCKALAEQAGNIAAFTGYPGAYHGFDDPDSPLRTRDGAAFSASGTGRVTQGTDPAARADAIRRVPEFFLK